MEKERIEYLVSALNKYTILYDEETPLISDKEWDKMYFELLELERETGYVLPNSPTQKINYQVVNELKKVKHNHFMGSADKTKDWDEFVTYFDGKDVVSMLKLDGLTCSLRYIDGRLVSAETRGNGEVGEDILHNALVIPSIPNKINYKDELIIDGEIICRYKDFEPFAKDYANPRNFASGSIRLLDSHECAKRNLTFVVWNIVKGFNDINNFYEKLQEVNKLGFTIVPWTSSFDLDAKEFLVNKAKELGYPIDGLVGRFTDIAYGESLGSTEHHTKAIYAFKFYDEEYETELLKIDYDISRTGVLTPVAVFKSVDTGDSVIERASLHNLSIMWDTLGEYPEQNQIIYVAKMNQIIPQVVRAEKNDIPHDHTIESVLKYCPICFKPTEIKTSASGVKTLCCSNPECSGKLINRIDHFVGKKGLDVKGLSKATIEKLIDWGWVNSIKDIFKLSTFAGEWKNKPGFGEKSVNNILTAIEISKQTTLEQFIAGLGIPLIGRTVSKVLAENFKTWDMFLFAVDNLDFEDLDGFGPEMNNALKKFDYTEAMEIAEMLTIAQPDTSVKKESTQPAAGLIFVITGKLSRRRDEIASDISAAGGKVTGSVSGKTNYLVCNDKNSNTGKSADAARLGIPVIDENELMEMLK